MVGFFERLGRGWYLTKVSLKILREEKQLLLLPVIAGLTLFLIVLSFVIGFVGLALWTPLFQSNSTLVGAVLIILGFVFYILLYFIGIYFNAALIACATIKLQGGKPTLSDGFRTASQSLGLLFMWALTAATVGMIIRSIQEKAGFIGKIIMGVVGIAWTIAIYFVVPVIIYERLTPWAAIKRSFAIMKGTWGEALGGTFGLGIIFGLLALLGIPLLIIGVYIAVAVGNLWIFAGFLIGTVVFWMILAVFAAAAEGILLAALYRYAVTGQLSPGFQATLYKNPWGAEAYYQPPPPTRPSY